MCLSGTFVEAPKQRIPTVSGAWILSSSTWSGPAVREWSCPEVWEITGHGFHRWLSQRSPHCAALVPPSCEYLGLLIPSCLQGSSPASIPVPHGDLSIAYTGPAHSASWLSSFGSRDTIAIFEHGTQSSCFGSACSSSLISPPAQAPSIPITALFILLTQLATRTDCGLCVRYDLSSCLHQQSYKVGFMDEAQRNPTIHFPACG